MSKNIDQTPEFRAIEQQIIRLAIELAAREGCPVYEAIERILFILRKLSGIGYTDAWYTLSQREQQVAVLVCYHYTNREIAKELSLSIQTIKTHLGHIFEKFQVSSRADLRKAIETINFDLREKSRQLGIHPAGESDEP